MSLEFDRYVPETVREGAPLIVLLHGRGSDMRDLMGLTPHLPYGAMVITPRAPFPADPWGYGPGWAWYQFLFRNRPEPQSFEQALTELEAFLAELPGKLPVPPGPLVLGGFSQGGTVSLAYALRHPGTVPMVINFSGFVADHPSVDVTPETVRGTRFFWGHGKRDPNIGFDLAEEGRELLREAGAELEARDYPIGHWIDPQELKDAVAWLEKGVRARAPEG